MALGWPPHALSAMPSGKRGDLPITAQRPTRFAKQASLFAWLVLVAPHVAHAQARRFEAPAPSPNPYATPAQRAPQPSPHQSFAPAPAPGAAPGPARTPAPSNTAPSPNVAPTAPNPAPVTFPLDAAIVLNPGATCLDREMLVRRVARWLQRDRIEADLHVFVQGDRTRANAVSFVIDRGQGNRAERRVDDAPADCDQFHSALALSIALAIDATLRGEDGGEVETQLPSDEELLAKPPKAEPPYFRLAFAIFGQATAGLLTSVSGALSGRLDIGFVPWLDLRFGALATQLSNQNFAIAPGTFSIELLAARLDVCLTHTMADGFRMAACAGGMQGGLRTRGHEDSNLSSDSGVGFWMAWVGSVEAQAELLPWLAIAASVDLVVPLARHRIVVTAPDSHMVVDQRKLTAVAVLVGAGPVFRFF